MVNLWRDGEQIQLHQSELLVGDVIMVQNGMEVPADGLLTYGADITCDESAMTGETLPLIKEVYLKCMSKRDTLVAEGCKDGASTHDVPSPLILSGSKILSGEGRMVVIAVGHFSALGKIQALLTGGEDVATPL